MNKQGTPLVSVIIPNYNHARYLDQRLQSVLGQTYQNFEVIILDDCSTDNSLEVIAQYKDNPHISQVVVNEKNSGNTFEQWDKGIHLAKGDVIWIAESDDDCAPTLLEELVTAFCDYSGTVLAYSTLECFSDNGERWYETKIGKNQYMSGKTYMRRYLSMYCYVLNASGAIFSKQAAQNIRPRYKEMVGSGDYMFWAEIAAQGNVAIVNKRLNYWRRHEGVVTADKGYRGLLQIDDKEVIDFIFSKVWVSPFRRRLVYAFHNYRIINNHFEPSIMDEVERLWHYSRYITWFDRFISRVYRYLVKHYGYHLKFA